MAFTLANRVKASTATTGTGAITLGSAVAGYQSFADGGIANGDTTRYVIEDGTDWEIGLGTYSSTGPTLTRTTVIESSNAGAAISLSGSAVVMVDASAADLPQPYTATTWTPALTFGGGSTGLTYSDRNGYYVQIGHFVHVEGYCVLSAKGSSTGTAAVSLPVAPILGYSPGSFIMVGSGASLSSPGIRPTGATASAVPYNQGSTGITNLTDANFTNTSNFRFVLTYYA